MITYRSNAGLTYEEWKLLRKESVGSSEVGAIILGNKWTSSLEIFYQKLGEVKDDAQSLRALLGKQTEPISFEMWKYYENSDADITRNYNAGRQIRYGINKKVAILNSKYPGRTSTPDIFIQPEGIYAGRGEGALEIKNTQTMILDSYAPNLPPDNVFQICDQMLLGDMNYGELFYFLDNRYFKNFPFEDYKAIKKIQNIIVEKITPFWENVVKAKPLYQQAYIAKKNLQYKLASEIEAEIVKLEPPVQNTDGYLSYINQRYKDRMARVGAVKGNDELYNLSVKYKKIGANIKKLEREQKDIEIKLKAVIGDNSFIDFGSKGKVTWFENKNEKRRFNIAV